MLKLNRRTLMTGVATAALATVLTGAPMRAIAEEPVRGGTLSVHMPQEQRTLNPALRASTGVYVIASKIMEPLMDLDEQGALVPMLATSWEGSEDGLTYTFKLREGVKWHDGTPFTSADVQFTAMELWKKYQNYGTALHANLVSVETPDDHTAVFTYSRPMPADLLFGAIPDLGYISPRHIYEGTDILANPANVAPIGTGPFKFDQYERGQYVIAVRNEDYWRAGFPYLDRIIWRFISDKAAAAAALESGQVHMSNYSSLSLADMDRLSKDDRFEVSARGNTRQPFQNTVEFNNRRENLKDVRVRRAIIHALDTDFFIENFLYGNGNRAQGPIPKASDKFFKEGRVDYEYDVDKANALLDEAGFERGGDGTRFELTMHVPPFGEDIPLWATFVQQSLDAVGIKVRILNVDAATYLKEVYGEWNFDLSTGWHIFRADPAISTMVWYRSGSPDGTAFTNQWGWTDPKADEMIDAAASELDTEKRRAMYPDIVDRLNTELPIWMAIDRSFMSTTSEKVRNHHNNPRWPSSHWADVWVVE
ncbi:ABC transporter substrate-binding protein [Roseovarius aestuarii]|nr:ABC transporter substrate-binding protein [Roseovarius aestuarii]